jgi:hypothetical protein
MSWRALVLGGLILGVALGSTAASGEWDPRDVAAADAYRASERERAERYRSRIARAPAPREDRKERAAVRRSKRSAGDPLWWERAFAAVVEEFDGEAIGAAVREARSWWDWWNAEASPRLQSWRKSVERIARAAGA